MDPFEKLPVEIILPILNLTADFTGVDSLLAASPAINAVFNANSSRIISGLLEACPSTAQELHHLFRIVHCIRTPSFQPRYMCSFILRCPVPKPDHDPSVARSMIHVASQIQYLACACLTKLFANFRSAHNAVLPAEWLNDEEGGVSPFSWIEEFRVYRALWRLQINSDLCRAVKSVPEPVMERGFQEEEKAWGGWTWSSAEIDKIDTDYFDRKCCAGLRGPKRRSRIDRTRR